MVGSCGVFTPRGPPAQVFRSVEAPAVGEARGGSPIGHPQVAEIEPDETLYDLFDWLC